MPGLFSHLHFAEQIQKSDLLDLLDHEIDFYYFGAVYPDLGYYPGNDSFISDLAHYVGSHVIPEYLFTTAKNQSIKAFAAGWLTHIYLDIYGHPLVNQFAANHKNNGHESISYEQDIPLHIKIENGLEIRMLLQYKLMRNFSFTKIVDVLPDTLISAYKLFYNYNISKKSIVKMINRTGYQINFMRRLIKILSHKKLCNVIEVLTIPFNYLISNENFDLSRAFLNSIDPNENQWIEYHNMLKKIVDDLFLNKEITFPHNFYNLDTGLKSKFGEYQLADKTFLKVKNYMDKLEAKVTAKIINDNWEKITDQFQE